MPNLAVITSTKAKPGIRDLMGTRAIIRGISKIEYMKYKGIFVPVFDVEKTLIDFAYCKIGLSKEDLGSLIRAIDKRKLNKYLKRCRKALNALYEITAIN